MIRRTVTGAVLVIAVLTFAFGFGNGWRLGLSLGVPGWIAPLVAPAVDLSVAALLASLQYLRAHGVGGRLIMPRLLLVACGVITFGLNTANALLAGQIGRACFDAIAPLLLIGWSEVGPRLLGLLHQPVPGPGDGTEQQAGATGTAGDRPGPSAALISRARVITDEYQRSKGRVIPRDALRAQLHVSNATAGELLRLMRTTSNTP